LVGEECVAGYVKGKGEADVSDDEIKGEEVFEIRWGGTYVCAGW
jgi:hypothetical protein